MPILHAIAHKINLVRPSAGDDLIGPRDIKKGLHMLANANVKELELEDDEDEDVQTDIDLEANRQKRIKKKTENDTLTS